MRVTIYSMTSDDLTANANVVKEQVLAALSRDGLLKAPPEEIAEKYPVVVVKSGILGRLFRKIQGLEPNKLEVQVLKAV